MMFTRYVSANDLAAIACGARRVNKDSDTFAALRAQVESMLANSQMAESPDEDERREAFARMLSSRLTHDLDRMTVVSGALTAIKALQEKREIPASGEAVTAQNYDAKVRELTDLLARYRPSPHEMNALARSLCKRGATAQASAFHRQRVDRLTTQAAALYTQAQAGALSAFGKTLTPEAAAAFVLADDAVQQLHTAIRVGEAVEKYVAPALLLCVMAGGVIALISGAIPAVPASIALASGIIAAAAVEVVFGVSATQVLDDALSLLGCAAGDAAAHLAIRMTMPTVQDTDLPEVDVSEIPAEA